MVMMIIMCGGMGMEYVGKLYLGSKVQVFMAEKVMRGLGQSRA